tara:strand:- start:1003 stop:1839 length:837 start_codon:yes stop_codon:yes gene_type:complete
MRLPNNLEIAVFAYNRPSHLRRVLISLEDYKIKKINLFLDGPKSLKDKILQKEIIFMAKFNKYLKVNLIRFNKNKGLAKSITSGIDNLARKKKNIIILEDDCVPRKEFFLFILDIIKKQFYKKNTVPICGYQLPEIENAKDRNIYPLFFKYFIPWGWFVTYKDWNEYRSSKSITKKDFIKNDKLFSQIKKIAEKKNKKIWSLKFIEHNLIRKRKIIFPNKSLIKNIGFDGSGVNSSITDKFNSFYTVIKRINVAKVHQNIILQKKQLLILSKRVKYFF